MKRTSSSGSKKKGAKKHVRFRNEPELFVDKHNFYAKLPSSSSSSTPSFVVDKGLTLIPPLNGVDGDSISFKVQPDGHNIITFLDTYHLQGEIQFKVKYDTYTDATYTTKSTTAIVEEMLCPTLHGFAPPCSTGLLSIFKRIEISFDSYLADQLSNFPGGTLNWMNRLAALETGFQPDGNTTNLLADYGLCAGFNRTITDLDSIMGDKGCRLWPKEATDDTNDAGGRTYFARLPFYPFRLQTPWRNQRVRQNLGDHLVLRNGALIPNNVELNLKLELEKDIPLLYRFPTLFQDHEAVGKGVPSLEWKQFVHKADPANPKYCQMVEIKPVLKSLFLVVRKIQELSPRIEQHFTTTYSVYRTALYKLENASTQTRYLSWDIPHQPYSVIFGFVRDS
jgi:hypothetical protein